MLVFSKEMMISRLRKEGRQDEVDSDSIAIMNKLDGREVLPNLWRRVVYGEYDAYYCEVDGKQYPVNYNDCGVV